MYNIEFDADTHIYRVNGEVKRSVTQILKDCGAVSGYDGIPEYYAERGTAVHDDCTLYAQGFLDWDTVRDDCIDYVRTFQRIMFEMGLEYISAGKPRYSKKFDYCGTCDLLMKWDGKKTLVELKTGLAPMWLGLQCAGYEELEGGIDDILGIELKTGKVYTKGDDWVKNVVAWGNINTGFFNYADWKSDKKRRRMKVIK